MSETMQTIMERRSVRKYKPDMVSKELIDQVVKAGTYAATGMGNQSPLIIAVTNKALRDKLSKANAHFMGQSEDFDPFYGAPVVLIVLADKAHPTYVYDGSLVMGNLMLAATEAGLGSCWIHRAKEEFEDEIGKEILKSLGIEGDYEGIGHCILGYADCEPAEAAPRKENYVYYIE
ncbi:nitroreductase [Ihubacter sp. mB4P-1]|uniref:nitroreductase n=1 Tax=Ihubacter sp. mB4P-1 TaxID=3242370 RepID=UPI0013793FCC